MIHIYQHLSVGVSFIVGRRVILGIQRRHSAIRVSRLRFAHHRQNKIAMKTTAAVVMALHADRKPVAPNFGDRLRLFCCRGGTDALAGGFESVGLLGSKSCVCFPHDGHATN